MRSPNKMMIVVGGIPLEVNLILSPKFRINPRPIW
ncbi:hypothetical protein SPLC1_S532450 [Arthrospira platensis C1]|nr:hypothetical protein SPLC1_S532450 [Arthrospira platensis C1]